MLPRFFFLNVLLQPTSLIIQDISRLVELSPWWCVIYPYLEEKGYQTGCLVLMTGPHFPLHTNLCTFLTSVTIRMDQQCFQLKRCKAVKKVNVSHILTKITVKVHTKQFLKCLRFPPATWETPLFWLQQSFSSWKQSWRDCLINFGSHHWLDSYWMTSPAAATCEKHFFFSLVGVEAFERAVHLPVQLLPGSFLDRTVYRACCFNSYFNSITDGVSAGAWCQRCFLILPRTSDVAFGKLWTGSWPLFNTITGPPLARPRNIYNCQMKCTH